MSAELALGCMNFGKRTDRPTSLRIIAAALEAGVTHLDTANMYADGESERIVGEALRGCRDTVTVASKVGFGRVRGRAEGLAREAVLAACDQSLARLGIDSIDLYYLHVPDAATPLESTLDGLGVLLAAGKIKAWGVSNFASWQILELMGLADRAGLPRPAVAQQLYNVLVRQLDIEYFAFAARHPIRTTVFNALAGGVLSGAHRLDVLPKSGTRFDRNPLYQRRYWQAPLFAAVDSLTAVAAEQGLSMIELAYAFLFGRPGVDSVLVGPATEAHLNAALAARSVVLSEGTLRAIDEVGRSLAGTDARYAR
ncbi:NADP-dependent oxidoreductase [Deltaproteobacteria bacterium]|nr:NADP-dependent oxidoreductase [Deltaproteobacteria bacterium]